MTQLTLSPCDVTRPTTWHIGIHLEDEASAKVRHTAQLPSSFPSEAKIQPSALTVRLQVSETLFQLRLRTADATARMQASAVYGGSTCCGGLMQWRVPYVPSESALTVNLSVTAGALHAIYMQFDSCARAVANQLQCVGSCTVGWVTTWDAITGVRTNASHLVHSVPMGETIAQSDKRRSGTWYIAIKALPAEAADYTMSLSLSEPAVLPPKPYCSGQTRFCASYTQRYAHSLVTTAADIRPPTLTLHSAAWGSMRMGARAAPMITATLGGALAALTVAVLHARSAASGDRRQRHARTARGGPKATHHHHI